MNKETLLKVLKSDALLTDTQLADRIGASCSEVTAARAELEQEGRILGYQCITNDDNDHRVAAFIEVRCTPERDGGFDKIANRIARFQEVKSCYLISGGYDLLILIESSSLPEVARFVSGKLSSISGVLSTSTHFRLKTYKKDDLLIAQEREFERISIAP